MHISLRALPVTPGLFLAFSLLTNYASAIDITLCSSLNTASIGRNVSNLQSNGLCSNYCRGKYVFAITSHENCWCSNYQPAQDVIVPNSQCNFPCLGFPYEFCGGTNLYGYLNLGAIPSGTQDATDAGSSSTASSSVSKSSPSSSGSSPTTSSSTSTTDSSSTSPSPKPSSTVQTVTVGGKVTTVIVSPTPTGTGDSSQDNKPVPAGSSGLGGGAIAGIVIGAVAGIALIGLLVWFLLRRRKQDKNDDFRDDPSVSGSGRGRTGSHQHDLSIAGSAASPGSAGNRSSMLQVDPRMDPFKQNLYARQGSAESINTLRDEHDYSRRIQQPKVLRAVNPDPET